MFSNMASASSQATSKSKAETNGDKDHAENKKGEIRTETTKVKRRLIILFFFKNEFFFLYLINCQLL